MLCVALPLAAADLLVRRASRPSRGPTTSARSAGSLLSLVAARRPGRGHPHPVARSSPRPRASSRAACSATASRRRGTTWRCRTRSSSAAIAALIAFNLADIWALVGICSLVLAIGVWLIRNRDLHPAAAEVRASGGRAFRRLFDVQRLRRTWTSTRHQPGGCEYHETMSMSTEPLFVPALASLDELVPHDGLLSPAELEEVARGLAARTELWEPLVTRDPEHGATSSSTRTTAWTPGSSPGCPAREPASTTTTSPVSGSASRAAASART